ncbi:hypothetical protein ACOME3_005735 [Neoechinorhynchus agilis]
MNVPKWTNATFQPDCPPSGTTLADGYMPCTPCGIQSLDQYLDGFTNSTSMGLSMGSLCLIVDDSQAHRSFASVIERCFVAEGLCSDQSVAIILNNNRESEFRSSIPAPNENMEPKEETDKSVKLDIAWRYERYDANRILCQSLSTAHGRQFRLNKKLDTRENRMRFFKLNLLCQDGTTTGFIVLFFISFNCFVVFNQNKKLSMFLPLFSLLQFDFHLNLGLSF